MDGPLRWVVAILVVAAIVGLVVLARGEPQHGGPTTASVMLMREAV